MGFHTKPKPGFAGTGVAGGEEKLLRSGGLA